MLYNICFQSLLQSLFFFFFLVMLPALCVALFTCIMCLQENEFEKQHRQTSPRNNPEKQQTILIKKSSDMTIPDARVRQLKDQLIRAKVYLGIGPIRANPHLVRELRLRIKDTQRVLGDATKDSDLPKK